MMNGTFEQLRAAVYGQAVGDALGVPYEFMPRDTFRCEGMTGYGTHNQPIGTWSDDTSMMLATLDSLIANEWQVNTESAITHAHAISMDACSSMVDVLRDGLIKGIWPQELDDEPLRGMPRDEVGSSGFVKDTYEAALWCLANTDDYASCVLAAVNLGDDTDTTAAVAGYLAGIKYGFDAIPAQWLSVLRGRELIEDVLGRTESAWH